VATPRLSSTLFLPPVWLPDPTGRAGRDRFEVVLGHGPSEEKKPGKTFDVLVLEDDRSIADMYRVQLEYDGYHVTVVPTGQAALEAVAVKRPDIILLDLLLPDRSGLEVMVELREKHSDPPPVIILSNYGEPAMIERGLALGAVEYLVKSRVTPDTVSHSIPRWIERGRTGEPPRLQ
jgi:two-component system OmpR family response regulator